MVEYKLLSEQEIPLGKYFYVDRSTLAIGRSNWWSFLDWFEAQEDKNDNLNFIYFKDEFGIEKYIIYVNIGGDGSYKVYDDGSKIIAPFYGDFDPKNVKYYGTDIGTILLVSEVTDGNVIGSIKLADIEEDPEYGYKTYHFERQLMTTK